MTRQVIALLTAIALGACAGAPHDSDFPPAERYGAAVDVVSAPLPDVAGPNESLATSPEPVTEPVVATSTPLTEPVLIEAEGPLVHEATKLTFAEEVAGFHRNGSKRYDEEGFDVGMGYVRTWKDGFAFVTVYVYPRYYDRADHTQQSAEDHFDDVIEMLAGRWDVGDRKLRRRDQATWADAKVTRIAAEYAHDGTRETFGRPGSEIVYVMSAKSWWVKVRVTGPATGRIRTIKAVDALLLALDLPATALLD